MAVTPRKLFVNLAVSDLQRSIAFFRGLGFEFNPQFTDEKAACMVVSEEAFVMLLTSQYLKTFTQRELCDTTRQNEALVALSCTSREEVDRLVNQAVTSGGKHTGVPKQDHGFMYGWSFYDPDGHHWELIWMDLQAVPAQ